MARFISMATFRSPELISECIVHNKPVKVGQIIGHVGKVNEKISTNPDGSQKVSLQALGEFEAVIYKTGRVLSSGAIYLPPYYAEELKAALESTVNQDGNVLFAVEISMVPTGKTIPYQWECTNLAGITRSKPLDNLKRYLSNKGMLASQLTTSANNPLAIAGTVAAPGEEEEEEEQTEEAIAKRNSKRVKA